MKDYILGVIIVNKENIKRFWNKHKRTMKKAVILVTVPAAVIIGYVVVNKILDKKTNSIFKELEVLNIKLEDEA